MEAEALCNCTGQVAVVIGGSGVLCGGLARALSRCGAAVAVVGHGHVDRATQIAEQIEAEGGQAVALQADVLDKHSLETLAQETFSRFGRVDILINGAGGAKKEATTSDQLSFYDLPEDAVRWVFDLNLRQRFPGLPGIRPHHGGAGQRLHPEHLFHGRRATPDSQRGLLGGQGGHRQFHTLVGGTHVADLLSPDQGECPRAGLFPDRAEPFPVD